MPINFFDEKNTFINSPAEFMSANKAPGKLRETLTMNIPSSKELTGIEIRLLPPFIADNNTEPFLLFPGFAKLYCLTIVVSDVDNQMAGGIDLQGFPRIGDKEHLPVNKTIFYWQQKDKNSAAPTQIHTMVSVIKSKKGLRDVGKIMTELKKDEDYKGIVKSIGTLAKNATGAGIAMEIVTQLSAVVGKYLGNVEDKPIGTIVNSYTALYGDFNNSGVVKRSYATKKVNFEIEIIVRKGTSEKASQPGKLRSTGKANVADDDVVVVDMMQVQ